jgi:hypothetical protein
MLYEEFLKGIGKDPSEAMHYAYKKINAIYMNNGLYSSLKTKEDAYNYYNHYKDDYEWVDSLYIGNKKYIKKEDNLTRIISEDEAKKIINEEFCFELDKIDICATAYYEATDFNHIVFMVNGYARVFSEGELYDIWR